MMNMMHGAPLVLSETNDWGSMADMMGQTTGPGRTLWGAHWILGLLTWVALIAVLAALTRYLWRKGDKVK